MTLAKIGWDTGLELGNAGDEPSFVDLEEVTEIDMPDPQTNEIDATHYKSPDKAMEFIAGLSDPGEMGLVMNWVPDSTTDDLFRALKLSGENKTLRITFPGGAIFTIVCWVKGYKPAVPIADRMTASATLRLSGASTWTSAP